MKKLTLIRHAEAANPTLSQSDFDRPLTAYGQHQAEEMGKLLAEQNFSFDQIFTSTAQRALSTAYRINNILLSNSPSPIEEAQLYNIGADQLYHFIETLDDDISHAVIVAHNPGLSYLLNDLLRTPIQSMSPCTTAQLTLNIDTWVEVQSGCGQLLNYDPIH
ncbi:Phosphohistidine phosphatase SixA [gamma proteobacterium IMCC2047]|nr:Phosphohistidine phosphatase SixA [gamma proteobacterium IMCC2047]